MNKSKWIICIFLFICLWSCQKEKTENIKLPEISLLEKKTSWGVVVTNYLRLRKEPEKNAKVIRSIPKGLIAEIISNTGKLETVEDSRSYWYRVDFDGLKGWVFGSYLKIFNSYDKAKKYTNQLK